MNFIKNKNIIITGGTGSFGHHIARILLEKFDPLKIIIFSRDEYKQYLMQQEFIKYERKLRFFLGDVRDKDRLMRAFNGVDIVIHAAALKHVPALEYNPIEAVKTNIMGATNVIDAAIDRKVQKVIAISSDKAVNPVNLYGATKLVSDKLFISANNYTVANGTIFSVVRYGNVAGSRGSIIPFFRSLIEKRVDYFPITDFNMTRFWLTLGAAVGLVLLAIEKGKGGEVFISKCPSFRITDLAKALNTKIKLKETGIRPGEKLHEVMFSEDDAVNTFDYKNYYIIYPSFSWRDKSRFHVGGQKVPERMRYSSDTNKEWLKMEQISKLLITI